MIDEHTVVCTASVNTISIVHESDPQVHNTHPHFCTTRQLLICSIGAHVEYLFVAQLPANICDVLTKRGFFMDQFVVSDTLSYGQLYYRNGAIRK